MGAPALRATAGPAEPAAAKDKTAALAATGGHDQGAAMGSNRTGDVFQVAGNLLFPDGQGLGDINGGCLLGEQQGDDLLPDGLPPFRHRGFHNHQEARSQGAPYPRFLQILRPEGPALQGRIRPSTVRTRSVQPFESCAPSTLFADVKARGSK